MLQRVLVTDDDPILRTLYRSMLKHTGPFLQVDYASTKRDAIKHIETSGYDIVLLDIDLGESDHDGFEILKKIKGMAKAPKVMMMSSLTSDCVLSRCKELGASGFTPKNSEFLHNLRAWVTRQIAENDHSHRRAQLH